MFVFICRRVKSLIIHYLMISGAEACGYQDANPETANIPSKPIPELKIKEDVTWRFPKGPCVEVPYKGRSRYMDISMEIKVRGKGGEVGDQGVRQ